MSDTPPVIRSAFARWLGPLLDALRALDGQATAQVATAQVAADQGIAPEVLAETTSKGVPRFANQVSWARFYLVKAGLIAPAKGSHGRWRLTDKGRETHLDDAAAQALADEIWAQTKSAKEAELPPPPADDIDSGSTVCWFVGASYGRQVDQTERFYAEGVWEIDSPSERDQEQVRNMRPGDRIAIKSTYVRKHGLPFDGQDASHSVMAIKATGVITGNPDDGHRVTVDWTPLPKPREWFFYTYQSTIWRVTPDKPERAALIRFAFEDEPQDFDFWSRAWKAPVEGGEAGEPDAPAPEVLSETRAAPPYKLADIVSDGSFLPEARLAEMLDLLKRKKNIVLQGPPGTGKTWLARRLGYALVRAKDPSRVTAVQFQPSYAYEDFVAGFRPHPEGGLRLIDGLFLRMIEQAKRTGGPVVLVIEEINRGDPAQVFGELLTLLEADKRKPEEALQLAYSTSGAPVHVPDNLYVIGTMNLADRSLALVDLALRRRFGFVDLAPELGEGWRRWCGDRGAEPGFLDLVATRIAALNARIMQARGLGEQFRVGHSYVTPGETPGSGDPAAWSAWWRSVVDAEIGPLLHEYWYEEPETARRERDALLVGQ